jgi:DNA-binding response OmpR family regulator
MTNLVPHVLIVDSDQTFARTLSRLLAGNGYDATALSTGAGVPEYLATRTVDLLLLDLSLPGEDGFSVLELLRRSPGSRHVPLLALSSEGLSEPQMRTMGLDASDVIGKPVQARELLARIRVKLRAGRALDQVRTEARSQAVLAELTREITVDLPPRELYQVLVRQVAAVLRIPRCSILLGRPGAPRMRVVAASDNPTLTDLSVDTGRYPEIQQALRTGEVVLVKDAATDPLYSGMNGIETRSSLVLPFSLRGVRSGVFFLRTGIGDAPLGETDLRFAARVSDAAIVAIGRALEREETERSQ